MPNLQFLNDTEVEREEISDQYTGEIDEEEEEEYDRDYDKGEDMEDDEGERNQEAELHFARAEWESAGAVRRERAGQVHAD